MKTSLICEDEKAKKLLPIVSQLVNILLIPFEKIRTDLLAFTYDKLSCITWNSV